MKYLSFLFFVFPLLLLAQEETVVTGKIQDKKTKEPLPFVSIGFKGTRNGTTSTFEGNFKLKTTEKTDSLVVTYVGYKRFSKKIKPGQNQNLLIELSEQSSDLSEVVIKPGVNPALRIINNARDRRDLNDQRKLDAYQYDSYNKVDIALNNISDEMKNRKIFKPIKGLFDTANQMKNEDGKYILPVFVSENFSQYFYLKEPSKNKELIIGSTSTGVGVGDKNFISDLVGTSLQQFNFNSNFVRILGKDFISPISNVCHTYYIYTLLDSNEADGRKVYKLKLNLRHEQDLGFIGHIWVEDSTWALKRIDVEISKYANINFIERLKIQQELQQTTEGPFLPYKNRLIIDIARIKENATGMVAKFYNSYSNIIVNQPKPPEFYDRLIEREENVLQKDTNFWKEKRPEPFSDNEIKAFRMVDSIANLPVIQTYIDVVRIVVEGYKRIGPLDWGPYVFLYAYNNVEGNRLRLGFRTNLNYSRKWTLKAYLAYGFKDGRFKYSLGADRILDRKSWTILSAQYRDDNDIIGITNDLGISNNTSNFFQAVNISSGGGVRLNRTHEVKLDFFSQPKRDWSYRVNLQYNTFEPLGDFVFACKKNYALPDSLAGISERFSNTQATFELRWAYKEMMVQRGNDRLRIRRSLNPTVTLSYTHGFKDIIDGGFDYNKIQLNITHHANSSLFGTADYWLTFGKIFGRLPYPLLDVARGNQSFFYTDFNYSLMNFYEFISDEYVHFTYVQHFEGLFFNRIPGIRNWKLRNVAFVKSAYGNLSKEDLSLLPDYDTKGRPLTKIHSFRNGEPYVEAGAGIENIFSIFSINYVHRFTYLDLPNVRKWGINVGIKFQF